MRKSVVHNDPVRGSQDQNRWSVSVSVVVKF
jgi:hypothetical protein